MTLFGLVLLAAVAALHWRLAEAELPAPFFTAGRFDIWCLHHDEKLLVPDLRYFGLEAAERGEVTDYRPYPVSAAFGLAGPWLALAGMRLFGFTNRGLRAWSLGLSLVRHLLLLGLCAALFPPATAAGVFALFVVNANWFAADHHAILENLLATMLVAVVWLCVCRPALFAVSAPALGLVGAGLLLVKPNFPPAFWALSACLMVASGRGSLVELVAWGAGGFLAAEVVQLAVLRRMGLLGAYCRNLRDLLWIHSGRPHDHLQQFFRPVGWRVFVRFPVLVADWLALTGLRGQRAVTPGQAGLAAALAGLLVWGGLAGGEPAGPFVAGVTGFLLLSLGGMAPFFYYPKRSLALLPLAVLALAAAIPAVVPGLGDWLWLPCLGLALRQAAAGWAMWRGRSDGVARLSRAVEAATRPGSRIVMQCYPFRFAWQVRGRRLLSGDDQIEGNASCAARAAQLGADYLMLNVAGDAAPPEAPAPFRLVREFRLTPAEADFPHRFSLFENSEGPLP